MITINNIKGFLFILLSFFSCFYGSLFMIFPFTPLLLLKKKKLFYNIFDVSIYLWFTNIVFLIEKFCKIQINVYQDGNDGASNTGNGDVVSNNNNKPLLKKPKYNLNNSIIIMNHRTRLDWLFYFCVLYRYHGLNAIKIILKQSLKNIPGAGWAMQYALFIFISRKWEMDKFKISKFIDYYKKMRKPVSVLIFPEGTDFNVGSKRKSNEYAKKEFGLTDEAQEYEYVLHPRVLGFQHLYNEMQPICHEIHDVTVYYEKPLENELDFIYGHFPAYINFYLNVVDIKNNNETINDVWLRRRWKSKEDLLKSLHENKDKIKTNNDENDNKSDTILYLSFIYWSIFTLAITYLFYTNFLIRLYFLLSISTLIFIQLAYNGIDNFIMSL